MLGPFAARRARLRMARWEDIMEECVPRGRKMGDVMVLEPQCINGCSRSWTRECWWMSIENCSQLGHKLVES